MKERRRRVSGRMLALVALLCCGVGLACGGGGGSGAHDAGSDGGGSRPLVTIQITTPLGSESMPVKVMVGTDPEMTLPVEFTVTGVSLAPIGSCKGRVDCGHVRLHIDSENCESISSGANSRGSASPIPAKFALCPQPIAGKTHVIELVVVDEGDNPFPGSARASTWVDPM